MGGENCINRRHPASSSFPSLSSLHPATQQLSQPPPSIFRSSNSITHSPNLSHLYCGSANQSSPGVVQIGGGCPDPIRTSPPDLDTPLGPGPGPGWTPLPDPDGRQRGLRGPLYGRCCMCKGLCICQYRLRLWRAQSVQVSPVPFNERENDFTRAPKVSKPRLDDGRWVD